MAFCSNCGGSVGDGVRFCPACGREVGAAAEGATADAPTQMKPGTAGGLDRNLAALLCYAVGAITGIVFLALVPYNRDPFIRFHAFQSIFYNIAGIALSVVLSIPFSLLPFFGGLMVLINVAMIGLWIVLMIQAYQGNKWKLPVIGDIAEKQAGA